MVTVSAMMLMRINITLFEMLTSFWETSPEPVAASEIGPLSKLATN